MSSEQEPDWAALYEQHKDAMHRTTKSVLRGTPALALAEDAVQRAFCDVMASPPTNVENWQALLVTTARRRALDLRKAAAETHRGPSLTDDHYRAEDYSDMAEEVTATLDRHRRALVLRALLMKLPEREREVIWRRVALDEARKNVASDLGVTPGRVSQIVTDVLQKLKRMVEEEER